MKPIKTPLLLIVISLSLCVISCKEKSEKPTIKVNDTTTQTTKKSEALISTKQQKNDSIPNRFKSRLRPHEQLKLGTIYTNTVTFLSYDHNYDYWYFQALKNKR